MAAQYPLRYQHADTENVQAYMMCHVTACKLRNKGSMRAGFGEELITATLHVYFLRTEFEHMLALVSYCYDQRSSNSKSGVVVPAFNRCLQFQTVPCKPAGT